MKCILSLIICLLASNIYPQHNTVLINEKCSLLKDRIETPSHCQRITHAPNSFADYLRYLPLKSHGSKVAYYSGSEKFNPGIYCAVIDQNIGDKDLHQCADAIIRLKADYHFEKKEFEKIQFNFTNGHRIKYAKWKEGHRIAVDGNKTRWVKTSTPSDSYENYWAYLEQIFLYAGTASLEKELKGRPLLEMQAGDVFIYGGFPGHAILVVDMCENIFTGKKYYLLGQSYMPAQQFHILNNPNDHSISPWYELKAGDIITPEWTFSQNQLKQF